MKTRPKEFRQRKREREELGKISTIFLPQNQEIVISQRNMDDQRQHKLSLLISPSEWEKRGISQCKEDYRGFENGKREPAEKGLDDRKEVQTSRTVYQKL